MWRVPILGFSLSLSLALAICAQEMRTSPKEHGLAGNVQSVETTVIDTSTKSYKLRPDGREELEDFGNSSDDSPGSPVVSEALRFDAQGKLVEDIDLERSYEQESYRYVYSYNSRGLLVEKAGHRENGSFYERSTYSYGPRDEKIEQLYYSASGQVASRHKFDEHQNIVSIEWYGDDGQIRQKESHRYKYLSNGNTLEQVYYPPERQSGVGIIRVPLAAAAEKSVMERTPTRYRTVFVRDDAGQLRKESRYYADGSLLEKKIFDQKGILRSTEWRLGDAVVTTTIYDDQGRETESHTIAKEGFGSPKPVDHHTVCTYDEHGNQTKILTSGPDESLIQETTNVFEYDNHGNWISKTETVLNNIWQEQPFPAAFETIRQFHRAISYFPDK